MKGAVIGLEAQRRLSSPLRALFAEHNNRVSDLDLGVDDAAVGPRHTRELLGAECALVELDGVGGTANDDGGVDGVVSRGRRAAGRVRHGSLLLPLTSRAVTRGASVFLRGQRKYRQLEPAQVTAGK